MGSSMKAWIVHDGDPTEYADLVFAGSESKAIDISKQHPWSVIEWQCDEQAWKADRLPRADGKQSTEGLCQDDYLMREMGWRCDGDGICGTCGLATFDGRFPVCESCGQCNECECDCCDKCGAYICECNGT